jgi:hypothetical protein
MLAYYCAYCRQGVVYLATDVLPIWGADMRVYDQPGKCGNCGFNGYVTLTLRAPSDEDVGRLVVRRPVSSRVVWTWRDSLYEAEAKQEQPAPLPSFGTGTGP